MNFVLPSDFLVEKFVLKACHGTFSSLIEIDELRSWSMAGGPSQSNLKGKIRLLKKFLMSDPILK